MKDGVTMLFSDIDKVVEPIVKQYDHHFLLYKEDSLCDVLNMANEPFIELPFETSAENMAMFIFNQIKTYLPIVKIELAETKSSNVIYETIN
jgi:6-pyruvoyl-tetrahydropterin synthase